jgi:23S rRNA (uracil1939-C5)-methyltransferase
VGVEGSKDAVQRAYQNAAHNSLTNVEFYVDNLQTPALNSKWTQQIYDKILLDPPRAGVLEIIPLIARLVRDKIVYVSCNPATLARDIGELTQKYQFKLESVGVLDMFPHTTHIESMAVLRKCEK